jgi:hypothetical protein
MSKLNGLLQGDTSFGSTARTRACIMLVIQGSVVVNAATGDLRPFAE